MGIPTEYAGFQGAVIRYPLGNVTSSSNEGLEHRGMRAVPRVDWDGVVPDTPMGKRLIRPANEMESPAPLIEAGAAALRADPSAGVSQ